MHYPHVNRKHTAATKESFIRIFADAFVRQLLQECSTEELCDILQRQILSSYDVVALYSG